MRLGPVATRRLAAAVLGVIAFVAVATAQRDQGLVRDEIVYMDTGARYAAWWRDFLTFEDGTATEQQITAVFGGKPASPNNPEHPPLMKTLFGLSEHLLHDELGWTSEVTGYRLPTAVAFGALVALIVLFAGAIWGLAEGLVAGLLMLLIPRTFFYAGMAAFDAPMIALWFASVYAYYRALASKWWCLGLALVFGLALATKHNALMLPAALLVHYLWVAWRQQRSWRRLHVGLWRAQPLIAPALFVGGPLVLIALWPWLWFDTWRHVGEWIGFHMKHVHYNFEYLGHNWNAPPFPWHIALVTTALTVPVVTLVAGVMGAVELVRRARAGEAADPERAPALLLFLAAGVAMGPFLLTSTPIFGADKHWAPAYPTICIFAGLGVVTVARRAVATLWGEDARIWLRRAGVAVVALMVGLAALVETVDAQPYALTHYNALAGGAPGGADLGMNRQFWGYSARGVLPWLDQRAAADAGARLPVYTHDASPAWGKYMSEGLLARTLPDAGREYPGIQRSKLAIVIHELHFNRHDYFVWKAYDTVRPAFVLTTDGVPIVSVYARE